MADVFEKKSKIAVNKKELSATVLKANTSLREKNKKLDNRAKKKESQLKALDNELKSLENEIKSLSSKAESFKEGVAQNKKEFKAEQLKLAKIDKLLKEKDDEKSDLDRLGKEKDILVACIGGMSSDLAKATALKEEIKILEADKELGLNELNKLKKKRMEIEDGLPGLATEVATKKLDHSKIITNLNKEIDDKQRLLGSADNEYTVKMAALNTNLEGLENHIKEKEQDAGIIESLIKQREHAYIDIETKFKQAENALVYAKELTDKEIERERIEKEKIRERFKQWKISALEEVARLKLKKKIESIDKAGLMEILNG
tara:strand:+ start:443 stop:1393 length:951 start_codon:yes stop_codon:yes gene_type:complete